jgi:hypothetical protein
LIVAGVTDTAGNGMPDTEVGTLVVDETLPAITGYLQNKDWLNGEDTLVVEFGVTEPLRAAPEVRLADLAMTREGTGVEPFRYALALAGTDLQGSLGVVVGLTDLAGNAALWNAGVVQVDAAPPALLDVQFSPPLARLGVAAYLTVTPNERLLHPPVLEWDSAMGEPGFGPATVSGLAYVFSLSVTSGVRSGLYRLATVRMVDMAGNQVVEDARAAGMAVDLSVDSTPPDVVSLVVGSARFSARPGHNQVVVTFGVSEPLVVPGRVEVGVGTRPADCAGDADGFTCTYTVLGDEPEGTTLVNVTATDAAGNVGFNSASVLFDFTPPQLVPGSSRIQVSPPAGCPLPSVTALTADATAHVQFALDEAVGAEPVVEARTGESLLSLVKSSQAGVAFVYSVRLDEGGHVQGPRSLTVRATDVVGNTSTVTVPDPTHLFTIDSVAPSSPRVSVPGAVVYRRVPWGFDEHRSGTLSPKTFRLEGGANAVDGDTTWVLAYDDDNPALAAEIGRKAVAGGALGTMVLNRADRTGVFVAALDNACNRSQTVRVNDAVWTATMGGKVPG